MSEKKSVFIALPAYAGILGGCVTSLLGVGDLYETVSIIDGLPNVSLARNLMTHQFLHESKCEHMLCLDSDIQFSREAFLKLLADDTHQIQYGVYARRNYSTQGEAFGGTGFTLVRRDVFATLTDSDNRSRLQDFEERGKKMYNFFPVGRSQTSPYWASADHGFFQLCAQANISVNVVRDLDLVHWGRAPYVLEKFEEMAKEIGGQTS